MARAKDIRISISSALNAAGIEATKQQVEKTARDVAKDMGTAAAAAKSGWADVKAAWEMGLAAIGKAWGLFKDCLRAAFHVETMTTHFKTLIGDMDAAREHMADLRGLESASPFSLDDFAKTSRALMVTTDGALGYTKSLKLIGDAATATGQPVEELGQAVGRLYAYIRDGQPLSKAVAQLRNVGVLTPEAAQKLVDLQDAGKSNAEIWAEVENILGKYKGAMDETRTTGEGLFDAIKTRWDSAVRTFGESMQETAKSGMAHLLDKAKELEEDGTLDTWANAVGKTVDKMIGWAANAVRWYQRIRDKGRQVGAAVGTWAGTILGGGTLTDANKAAKEAWRTEPKVMADERKDEAEHKARKAAQRKAEAEKRDRQREAQEKTRIQEQLATAQTKIDQRNAEKAAEAMIKADAKAAAERERQAQKQLDDRIREHQQLLAARQKTEAEAQGRKTAAESKLQQAWGWYRDKGSMAAQMAEEKADAAARKQYVKDFDKLKRKRDWRTAENLSVDEEAVRRVALAQEEKAAAEKHLAAIEANFANARKKFDELLAMK